LLLLEALHMACNDVAAFPYQAAYSYSQ
jgi:hypothetical protein